MPSFRQRLWRNRDFSLLLTGQLVSYVGTQAQNFALPLVVLALTGSAGQAGVVLGLQTAAFLLFGLVAGALADRVDRRRLMIGCDAGRAAVTGAVAVALATGHLLAPELYPAAALLGVLTTAFDTASTAALPAVVGAAELPAALGASQSASNTVRMAGATLGGALYALGRAVPFAVNALSFVVSAVLLRLLRTRFRPVRTGPRSSPLADIRDGIGWLWRQPVLRVLAVAGAADNLRYGAGYLVIVVLARRLGASAVQIGLIFTGAAIGATLGSLLAARAVRRFRLGHIVIAMTWVTAVSFPLYAVAPTPLLLGAVAAAESVIGPISAVAITAYRLRLAPDELRGRVTSATTTLTTGAQSVGTMLGGTLIAALGAVPVVAVCTGWLLVLAAATTAHRPVRRAPRVAAEPAGAMVVD